MKNVMSELERLWRAAQIDYPLQRVDRGPWKTIKDHSGNYLCTVRNKADMEFIEALIEAWPAILEMLEHLEDMERCPGCECPK